MTVQFKFRNLDLINITVMFLKEYEGIPIQWVEFWKPKYDLL